MVIQFNYQLNFLTNCTRKRTTYFSIINQIRPPKCCPFCQLYFIIQCRQPSLVLCSPQGVIMKIRSIFTCIMPPLSQLFLLLLLLSLFTYNKIRKVLPIRQHNLFNTLRVLQIKRSIYKENINQNNIQNSKILQL